MSAERAQARAAWWFLTPSLGLIAVFFVLPVIGGLLLSLTDFDIYAIGSPENARFMGLGNYTRLLANPLFWKALGNTFVFVVLGGPLSVAVSLVALIAAEALARRTAARR